MIPPEELLAIGSRNGAAALGLASWPDTAVDLTHHSLAGVARGHVAAALVYGCSADVISC